MPDQTNVQIPPPANWQDFERLCADLWRHLWKDPYAQMNGRTGQVQCGVDIWGSPKGQRGICGIQCKGKDGGYEKTLTARQLRDEVTKARSFRPALKRFVLATSARNDVSIQKLTRELSAKHRKCKLFSVDVHGWDEISRRLARYPEVLQTHYPQFFATSKTNQIGIDVSALVERPPTAMRRLVSQPDLQGFEYRTRREKSKLFIEAHAPYLSILADGGPIPGLRSSCLPLIGRYPCLDIKVLNNSPDTLFLSSATLRVSKSKVIDDVIPVFSEPAYDMHLRLGNVGWGEIRNAWIEYDLTPIEADSTFQRPFPFKREVPLVEGGCDLDLADSFAKFGVNVSVLRRKWRTFGEQIVFLDGETMERAQYDAQWKLAMRRFFTHKYEGVFPFSGLGTARVAGVLHFDEGAQRFKHRSCMFEALVHLHGPLPAAPKIPSFEYDACLQETGVNYEVDVPVSQEIKSGEADRFCIRISSAKSTIHDMRLELKGVNGAVIKSKAINLRIFCPRGFASLHRRKTYYPE